MHHRGRRCVLRECAVLDMGIFFFIQFQLDQVLITIGIDTAGQGKTIAALDARATAG